jgi:glyoxylase-like metal-dependent hydrolase (beta-lactamase superfamily II)
MRVHHLNCVSACPLGGLLMDGASAGWRARLASHCLLVETEDGLVLIDTGYGLCDIARPRSRLNPVFLALMKPELREEMSAIRQIEALGFQARDVRHIVLSHLDFDHAGGLDDFPGATVHLLETEVTAATAQKTVLDRMRYRPQQWSTRAAWRTYAAHAGERWLGFDGVRSLAGLPPEILLVPLVGHTLGHAGVAIERDSGWLFYAADAYFYHAEMQQKARCTPGLRFYQTLMEKDRRARLANQGRLRNLAQTQPDITVFCAHDVRELERLSGRSSRQPQPKLPFASREARAVDSAPEESFEGALRRHG